MVELMPHQKDAVERLSNGKILWGGVGTGKSMTVMAYYMKQEAPKDVYVITTARKRDSLEWLGEAAKFGVGDRRNATVAGVITIDSWNNIPKYVDVEDAFFVFDEQRLVGLGAWTKAFQQIAKRNNWVMLSATPGDTWMDYIPVFVANGLYKNATQFKREHVVYAPFMKYPVVLGYRGEDILERYRNMILVEMPFIKHTKRILRDVTVSFDKTLMQRVTKDRWHIYEDRPVRDVGELFRVMRTLVNSDPSRLQALRELLERHPKIIVYYNFDYELDILRSMASEIEVAEWNGHRKQPVPTSDRWLYLVQYVSGAEAWNCVETDAMVFYSLTYSYKNFEQSQGRIDRLNTKFTDLFYYILLSNSAIDLGVRKSLVSKEHFNEKNFARQELGIGEDWVVK